MYISAVLKKAGHDCVLLLESEEKDLVAALKREKPDLVGFSSSTGQHNWVVKTSRKIKQAMGVPIVAGGPHPTYEPNIIKEDCIDIVCRGEADYALLELMDCIRDGRDFTEIQNLWVKKGDNIFKNEVRPYVEDLDEFPFADRELYYGRYSFLRNLTGKNFLAGRGCANQCTFCHNHLAQKLYDGKGTFARKRSPRNLIEEIKEVRERYPMEVVNLERDDFFLSHRDWCFEFLELYAQEVGLPFVIQTRPDSIDEKIAAALKKANCVSVAISIETADDEIRNTVLKKNYTNQNVRDAVYWLKRNDIFIKTFNMLGLPGEDLEAAIRLLKFNIELGPSFARCAIIQPYPMTEFYDIVKKHGLLSHNFDVDNFKPSYFTDTVLNLPNRNELVNLQKFFPIAARFPFLLPLIKILIKVPVNPFYNRMGFMVFGYYGRKYTGLTLWDSMHFLVKNFFKV